MLPLELDELELDELELDELELAPSAPLAPHESTQYGAPASSQCTSGDTHTQLSCEQAVPGMAEQSVAMMH